MSRPEEQAFVDRLNAVRTSAHGLLLGQVAVCFEPGKVRMSLPHQRVVALTPEQALELAQALAKFAHKAAESIPPVKTGTTVSKDLPHRPEEPGEPQ